MRAGPLALLAALALLGGCEAELTVDFTDGPIDTADEVVLDVTRVALQTADGAVATFALDDGAPIDLLLFQKGETYRLLDSRVVEPDRYTGIALDFGGDSYVTRDDGTEVEIITPTTRRFAPIDLLLADLDSARLVLDLNLRFSLVDTGTGSYTLDPVWRAVRPGDTGVIAGSVATAFVESTGCLDGRPAGTGVAVYLFEGDNAALNDYTGQPALIDAARVEFDASANEYRYALHFVPAGDYTVALTCQADDDDPAADDAVAFDADANVTVAEGGTVTRDF